MESAREGREVYVEVCVFETEGQKGLERREGCVQARTEGNSEGKMMG
jgi:hypothetical protein